MRYNHLILLALSLTLITISALTTRPLQAKMIKRDILAVYDGEEVKQETVNTIHEFAEMPLEHLGFKVHYVDISKRLPNDAEMAKYDYIISWFTDNVMKGAKNYIKWLTRNLNNGKKLLVMGDFGFDYDGDKLVPYELKEAFYKAFNISFNADESTNSPLLIEILHNEPEMTEFERKLKGELTFFEDLQTLDKNAKVYLKLKRRDSDATFDAIFISNRGAYIGYGYSIYQNPGDFQTRWRINPFKFFKVFFNGDFPKPDVTTLNGTRITYSHIDGDGIRNVTTAFQDEFGRIPSGEATYELILKKINLPISVSIVVGDFIKAGKDEKEVLVDVIKKSFELPNVEAASHGWAHPFEWTPGKITLGIKLKGYKFSPQNEIGNSIKYINDHLAPPSKKTDTFFWTGGCNPGYGAMKYVYDHHILNLNGGDTRFDNLFPSYTFVAPLFRHVDGLLQYYTANSNENIYTNGWDGPFYGFRFVTQTFERTESPIRIRPVDIYYHFYTMEKRVAVDAIYHAYNWVQSRELAAIFTTDYIDIMSGFVSTNINKVSDRKWIITNNNQLRTIRFDEYDGHIDMLASRGVLGYRAHQGSVYVHLDNGKKSEIVLTGSSPNSKYLIHANGQIRNWKRSKESVNFEIQSMAKMIFEIGGVKPNEKYKIKTLNRELKAVGSEKGVLSFKHNFSDDKDQARKKYPANQFKWIKVTLEAI
ncbi:MAG: DUF2194 domain-containing protein [Deltaproteobacteria bacterium]|jgi:polysaccharide biosynthesis protein PelA|nr:DUF2194 domain-containing protein [Deltaproteobacteria bacterium]